MATTTYTPRLQKKYKDEVVPVSYTHLDVYKRQSLLSVHWVN